MQNTVAERRVTMGLSQEDLASKVGVSRQTINAIERDRYDPRLKLAFRLAGALSCRIDEMFTPPESL